MKIWISKHSEVPIHEQLTTQLLLAVTSGELKSGQKLPSTRELARRFEIHANTVSAAYRELANKGWLEFRKGSGVYVRALDSGTPLDSQLEMDQLISTFLQIARSQGFSLGQIRKRIQGWLMFQPPDHFLVIEPEVSLRQILMAEIGEATKFPCRGGGYEDCGKPETLTGAIPVALYGRADIVREFLPKDIHCFFLKSRSVQSEIQRLKGLPTERTIVVISGWKDFVKWAHATLVAAGVDPARLSFRNAFEPGWQKGLTSDTFVIADIVQRRKLPVRHPCLEFRLIAESCLEDLCSYVDKFLASTSAH